jgi:hypothetical protein
MARKLSVPKDFQAGDIVLVECSGSDLRKSKRWKNGWSHSMDAYIGKCWTVHCPNTDSGLGVYLKPEDPNDAMFGFPEKTLRLIKRGDKCYFREGDKVLVARKSETIHWNGDGGMDTTLGKVYEVANTRGQTDDYRPSLRLETETGWWFYGTDCIELYTGQVTDEQPQPTAIFTITEPLQSWERF